MVLEAIKRRRSVRKFQSDRVSDECIKEIIKAAQFAPTAMNKRAVDFIIVKKEETKNRIFEIVGQEFVKDAPVIIVPAVDPEKSVLPIQDLSIATAHIFLQATDLGLGTVWKNLEPDWERGVKKLLGVPENYRAINIIPVGYAAEELPSHSNGEFSEQKIHWERW